MRRSPLFLPLALLAILVQAAPRVQSPDAAWVTFTTAHYRIHCPAAFEDFGRDVAGRVEGIHDQYLALIGFVYPKPIDIVIQDPVLEPNGRAFAMFARPHVELWKTAPEPDSEIGHHRGWAELVLTHELAHMHHLLRPARKPGLWKRWTAVLGPVSEKSPRWIIEGYATLIEGRLTGSGRPHSAVRAAVLRQWACEGKLPSYEALGGAAGFLGGSFAYLGGSAYLEWLEGRAGDPKAFRTLWTRLAGKGDFDASFKATFGFSPKDGYQRYCAELTHTALELERRARKEGVREGEIVTQLGGWATDLALSPDGSKLLARVLDPRKPGLEVWDLKAEPKPAAKKDPDEPPEHPALRPVLPPTYRLGRVHGALPWKPRWTGADTIGFQLRLPDQEGMLKPTSMQWTLKHGIGRAPEQPGSASPGALSWKEVDGIWNLVDGAGRPLTRTLAAAWNPVATPDGKWVYYTQLSASGVQIRRLATASPPPPDPPLPVDPEALVKDQVLPRPDEPGLLPPPVAVEPRPYRIRESHDTFHLAGYSATPAGLSAQLGAGGNDILGRLNWQLLAGLGDGAGPRGGMAGLAWRGWRWAPSLQLFSVLERPSREHFTPVTGFDRERRGAELALEANGLGRPRFHLRPVLASERATVPGGEASTRTLWGAEGDIGNTWSRGEQGLLLTAAARGQQGRTEGHAWNLGRLALTAGWLNPWAPLRVQFEEGRIGGTPTPLDRFHLGGTATSLLPPSLDANRSVQPALPAYTATGDRLRRLRGSLGVGVLQAYLEHASVWQDGAPRPSAQRVAGLELDSRTLGLPADVLRRLAGSLSFAVGLHRPLDGRMRGRTVGTLSVIVRP